MDNSTPQTDWSVALIDHDKLSSQLATSYLLEMGYEKVQIYDVPESLLNDLMQGQHQALVMTWKLNGLSPLTVFSRLRADPRFVFVPILVVSSDISSEDFQLLREYPCTLLLNKPLARPEFESKFNQLVEESRAYQERDALIEAALSAISEKGKDADQMIQDIWQKLPNPIPTCLLLARKLRQHRKYQNAEDLLRKIMEFSHDMIPIVAELGKVLHAQGKYKEAGRALLHAQSFSPKNIERLLILGEQSLSSLDLDKANRYFEAGLEIDPEHAQAQAGQKVASTMRDFFAENQRELPQNFASALNLIGINFVRDKQHGNGVQLYESALHFVRDPETQGKLSFNLGLGYLRWGKYQEASVHFNHAIQQNNALAARARHYLELGSKIAAAGLHSGSIEIPTPDDQSLGEENLAYQSPPSEHVEDETIFAETDSTIRKKADDAA